MKKRVDVEAQTSTRPGVAGVLEGLMRRFKTAVHALTLAPLYLIASACIGVALAPGAWLFECVSRAVGAQPAFLRYPALGITLALGYFLYGFTLLLVVPAVNLVLVQTIGRGLRPWRGPYYSLPAVWWYVHNGLTYLVRYTFLEFVTPTPFNLMFYRMMGMKIGEGTQINTSNISDPSLIELGAKVTIGGSATLVAHYGMGGFLVIAPLKIGQGVTIGLKATIMGGVVIGDGARIIANSVVLPRTLVPAGETWGGVPAMKINIRKAA